MVRNAFNAVVLLFNIAIALILVWAIRKGAINNPTGQATLEYKDFISILLTSLGVMIALAAMLVAVAAIWTYKNAMELIERAAQDAAEKVARDHAT